ncbi:hypothetical protein BBI08_05400 [Planococcus halocryophilus]|uniref:Uncharacterized protein n=1 Tax=Planococcus halocryophilus TaxID=1215089 RepID=A0A1C7DP82_9BACL|nr:hypothetical protein BBI08_05400 [Planococcus halocryophilus]
MFRFKRSSSSTNLDLTELKTFVSKTLEVMLISREETIYPIRKYDLLLVFTWEKNCIEGSIFQLSRYQSSKNSSSYILNAPLFLEKRDFYREAKSIVFIDTEKVSRLTAQNLLAFQTICKLIDIFDIEATSSNRYKCIWKED